MQSEISDQ